MNEYALTLDLAKAKQRQQQTIFVRQGDRNATTIVATITDHGAAASTSGLTARFSMRLPDGTHYYRKAASLSGNVATVALDEAQAASVAGRTDVAYFQLLQGSTVVASTESFTVIVLPDALAGADVPESYDSAIQDAIDALDAAVEQMPDMVEDVLAAHPEWTTTVQDGSVSDAKLYQGTDGILARVQRLQYRLANMLTNALPEGETATASDAAKTPVAGLALYGRSTQAGTPTPSVPVAIESVGAANLLPNAASTQTVNGLTFTVKADGSITVTGTATARTDFVLASGITFAAGTYTISGAPQSTGTGDWNLRVDMAEQPKTNYVFDNGYTSGNNRTNAIPAGVAVDAIIRVYAGKSPNATFYPMLNAGSTACPYVPYGNVGLWARGRNLWQTVRTQTVSGVTFTANADGSVTLNGTATATINQETAFVVPTTGTYRISGCPAGGGSSTYQLWTYDTITPRDPQITDTGSGATGTLTQGHIIVLRIRIQSGYACNNVTLRPMLTFGSAAQEFVPYTYTVTPIDLDGHELRSLPDGTRDEVTVGADGHAVLTQRVGTDVWDGSSDESWRAYAYTSGGGFYIRGEVPYAGGAAMQGKALCSNFPIGATTGGGDNMVYFSLSGDQNYICSSISGVDAWREYLAEHPITIIYQLKEPITHDLGTIDPVPLVGPDLTAQAIPTAPFALRYERDLNATLARLEAAISDIATS